MSPKLAVCIATYQGAAYIEEQLVSVLAQLGEHDEIYLSDDGSSDATVALAIALSPRISIVSSTRVGGVVANFERVLLAAFEGNCEIFALCDQDDVWLPGRLDAVRRALSSADVVLLDGLVVNQQLEAKGQTISESIGVRKGVWRNLFRNSFIGCCMAFRREVLAVALPFPPNIVWHDWYIGLVAELCFKVARFPEPLILYRRHSMNHSPTGEKSGYSSKKRIWMRVHMVNALFVTLVRRFWKKSPLHRPPHVP